MENAANTGDGAALADQFSSLPEEYQNVLRLAQETHNIKVTPLQQLKGGRTDAYLYLVSVSSLHSGKIQHLILKLDHKSKKSKMDELERHNNAVNQAPPEFAGNHLANLAFDRIEFDGSVAIFYTIAGQSLQHYQSLASYQQQNKLEEIFSKTNEVLLTKWNSAAAFEQAVHPQKVLANWLGYRLQPGGNIEHFLEDVCHIQKNTPGLLIQGNIFPNPLIYARTNELWEKVRPIDTIVGFQHGDLNIGNILVKFSVNTKELTGYYLIDFALYKSGIQLFYDQHYLEISYLIRELSRVSLSSLTDLITRFAEQDILDSHMVPIELAGSSAVINAGRKAFDNWVKENYPSLSDDLWGQFRLAAVAAGLNYCNKVIITNEERLAGLIFAAAHLKRYHAAFGLAPPVEVKHLEIISRHENSPEAETYTRLHKTGFKNNLPAQTTPFIGRKKEFKETSELLQRKDVRLLTLTGPGGTGKTRLALKVAADLKDNFEDGIYFVDLAPFSESGSAITAIARSIGLRETSDQSLLDVLKLELLTKKLLFLLDNFEQVTSATPIVGELLRDCPELKLLITSREALHIRGEHIYPVPTLAMPGADLKQQSVEQLTQFEAVRLFIDRALAVKPNFEVTKENAPAVAGICQRLDGLPLAIELAAARINLFSPKTLLERVGSRLKFLRGGARDLPIRQQTLRQTIDWSYDLLDAGEKQLFAMLSLFSGCTFESVEIVTGGIKQLDETGIDILDGLTSLVDRNLIRRIDQNNAEPRLLMLETIREYAKERLEEDTEFNASARMIYASYFADFAQLHWKSLTGDERETTLKEIESDIENLQTAWQYWVLKGDLEQLQKLTACLWMLYDARGWHYATVDLTTDLLKVLSTTPSTPERAQQEIMLQTSLARVLMAIKGCTQEVEDAYTRALELCRKHGEIPQSLSVLRALASFYLYVADFEKSARFGEQILNLADQVNDVNMKVEGHLVFGYSLIFSGSLSKGLEHLDKGMSEYDPDMHGSHTFRFGASPGVTSYTTAAICLWMLGFPDRSLKLADNAIVLANKLNHPFSVAYALFHTGLLHLWRREGEIVLERAKAVLEIAETHDFQLWKAVAICLHGAALALIGQADNGLTEINRGLEMYTELKTPPVFWPMLLLIHANACIQAGQSKKGLAIIDEALEIIGKSNENPLLSEFYRFKGDVLLMISSENNIKAESILTQAMELARKHGTGMFELRAAMSLCKLWQRDGKMGQGKKLLSDTYGKFTEGFTIADLTEAKDLLSKLS